MEMCYNGTLVMPSNYVVVNDNEMEYVDGGFYIGANKCATIATYVYGAGWGVGAGLAIAALTKKITAAGSKVVKLLTKLGSTIGGIVGAVIGGVIGFLTVTNATSFLVNCCTADRKNTGASMTWYGVGFYNAKYY